MRYGWRARSRVMALVATWLTTMSVSLSPVVGWAQSNESATSVSRTPWGDPDIGGVWNSSTVTPLQRPAAQADKEFLTEEEAATIERLVVDGNARANAPSTVRTEPLPAGGNVGAYNSFWLDRGTTVVRTRRTSLVVDPPNGRLPDLTPAAARRISSPERLHLKDVREGLAPAVVGVVAGLLGSLAVGKTLGSILYGVAPTDPGIMVSVTAVLLVVALVATLLPAMRASRIPPASALRTE